jgi:hypothetical protein
MRRLAYAVALGVALAPFAATGPALAQERGVNVSVTPQSAAPGDDVRGTLTGCDAGQQAQISLAIGPGGVINQGTTDADGRFVAVLPVPGNAEPGEVNVVALCQVGGTEGRAGTTLTIVSATGQGGTSTTPEGRNELPLTGPTDVLPEATAGAALIALGAALAFAGRRRVPARHAR